MNSLLNFIFEGSNVFNIIPKNAQECKDYFDANISNKIPLDFFEFIFNLWDNKFESASNTIPFRCSPRAAKLDPCYIAFINDIVDQFKKKLNIKHVQLKSYSTLVVENVRICFGHGSLKRNRSAAGAGYEATVHQEIKDLILILSGYKINNPSASKQELSHNIPNKYKHLENMYIKGALDEIIDLHTKQNINLDDYISLTDSNNIRRNKNNELFDQNFCNIIQDADNVLSASGPIIADITIDGVGINNPVYISIKMRQSQSGSVSCKNIMYSNKVFQNAVKVGAKYSEIEGESEMLCFKNFCSVFGLDPSHLYQLYQNIHSGISIGNGKIKLSQSDPKISGCLIQKIIGGNHWYINPETSIYVSDTYKDKDFKVESARVTNTGKCIYIDGKYDGLGCRVIFRTSSHNTHWPSRFFIQTDMIKLIELIGE